MSDYFIARGYVEASNYRTKVVQTLGDKVMTPTAIAKKSNIRTNHISNVLTQLKGYNIVICLNEEARKGRLYKLTEKGKKINKDIE